MNLYLVQHGKSRSKEEDVNRPLNAEGIKQTENVAGKFIQKKLENPAIIFCSNKLRAKQTAEILGQIINPAKGINVSDDLNPDDNPFVWFKKINKIDETVMIVGHLPHLKRLASLLIPDNESINFVNSGIVCIAKEKSKWILTDVVLQD
ncbi:MAG: phosphohistidine phosphatase SixA [Candidatus Goldbacteria bacterium]|nr:phosphohistidine phosphatase SixA [Candidatus Goldiibacteriota bacterium]HPD18569.1 phosphohistidine phosphatase SixA [Candidatus Goldiibacteriota bacterium]